jgi:transcription antitermination factor NusG
VTQKGEAMSAVFLNRAEQEQAFSPELMTEAQWWFAVQTKPRHEKRVDAELKGKGIHSFLPLHRERRQWSDRQQWVELPLFSHYVFVRIPVAVESRTSVLRTNGVIRFAGAPGRGTPLHDEQIENLQAIAKQKIPMAPHKFIQVGERVRIRGGALNGMEGVLAAIKNARCFVVSVDVIQKSVAIRVDGFEVERV